MRCWYCEKESKILYNEYENTVRIGICQECGRHTIETLDGTLWKYLTYSGCLFENVGITFIGKWAWHGDWTFLLHENRDKKSITKIEIYPGYIGHQLNELIGAVAVGGAFGTDRKKLDKYYTAHLDKLKTKLQHRENSVLTHLLQYLFGKPKTPDLVKENVIG